MRDTRPSGRAPRWPRGLERLLSWDRLWVQRWHRFRGLVWLDRILLALVRLGDGWGWALAAAALYIVLPWPRFAWIAGQGAFAALLSVPLYMALKAGFRRRRPHRQFRRVSARVTPRDEYSFPSGHTMNNLAIAASIAFHLPWLWPFALVLPAGIGLLRVVFGVHFVTDIAGGAAFGLLVAGMAVLWYPLFANIVPFLPGLR